MKAVGRGFETAFLQMQKTWEKTRAALRAVFASQLTCCAKSWHKAPVASQLGFAEKSKKLPKFPPCSLNK